MKRVTANGERVVECVLLYEAVVNDDSSGTHPNEQQQQPPALVGDAAAVAAPAATPPSLSPSRGRFVAAYPDVTQSASKGSIFTHNELNMLSIFAFPHGALALFGLRAERRRA